MSRRGQKRIAVLLGLLALAVAAFAVYICLSEPQSRETVLLTDTPAPGDTAAAFLDALCRGDYDTASACLRGTPDLGLDTLPEEERAQLLARHFRQSWSWAPAGDIWQKDAEARLPVEFTALNLTLLTQGLDAEVQAILAARLETAARQEELYNEDHTWREEAVLSALDQALRARLADPAPYLSSTRLTLLLEYEDLRWVVVPDEMLYTVLAGEVTP